MKILIVNFSDINGGAARAAYRLHQSLIVEGIDSKMLVQNKNSDDYTVLTVTSKRQKLFNQFRPNIDAIPLQFYKKKEKTFFSVSWLGFSNIIDKINNLNPDIVHLHWINKGMIRIEDLLKIKAPIVWTLHDNWAFTGGCHIMHQCEKYQKGCGFCPVLLSSTEKDISRKLFNRKQKVFTKINNLTIIGLSKWLNETSKDSFLLKGKRHINIPNPIDSSIFNPLDKKMARNLWKLPVNKKLALFGAISATNDKNKGFKELTEALLQLNSKDIELVVFGSSKPKDSQFSVFKIHYLGHLHDDVSLVTLYNAVDVMIVPSLQENLSNAIMESLACATPVVAFNIGGNSDMIEHKKNGYLAKPFNTSDLAAGIEWVLDAVNYDELCQNAREKVLKEFDSQIVAERYIKLYREILND